MILEMASKSLKIPKPKQFKVQQFKKVNVVLPKKSPSLKGIKKPKWY